MREVIMRLTTKPFEKDVYAEIVQELVRCRDCVHYDKLYRTCEIWKHGVLSNGYCYRGDNGERRTE